MSTHWNFSVWPGNDPDWSSCDSIHLRLHCFAFPPILVHLVKFYINYYINCFNILINYTIKLYINLYINSTNVTIKYFSNSSTTSVVNQGWTEELWFLKTLKWFAFLKRYQPMTKIHFCQWLTTLGWFYLLKACVLCMGPHQIGAVPHPNIDHIYILLSCSCVLSSLNQGLYG